MNNPLGVTLVKGNREPVRPCSSVGRVTEDLIWRSWVRFPPRSKDFFFVRPCSSVGRVTEDLIWRSWVRFPPRSKDFFFERPCSSVGRVTEDLIRRSWVRFPPRSKDFFFASCGSLFPFTRANAQWVIHGFK